MKKYLKFPKSIQAFLDNLLAEIKQITGSLFIGCYVHGSLAMGGFQPENSDIDLLVVLNKTLDEKQKQQLAALFLNKSNNPYPIEISFLLENRLKKWEHPFPYIFHFSEDWRKQIEKNKNQVIEKNEGKDADLAAHIAVLMNRGITLECPQASSIFPAVPRSDFIASIHSDYKECLVTYTDTPVYALLNMLRFYWYLKANCFLSKQEAGKRAYEAFPKSMHPTIKNLLHNYQAKEVDKRTIEKQELTALKEDIDKRITEMIRRYNLV
ncbi:aminoglycoside adenylyltransferase domain-containing protein [Oceanobacillus timonensis]|uniref:aminoglycoside adenylyltransferase domain-containing protein n=1 Tax=Oceanobacillus timonensis TaxID=1926285 RepID=UPI0015C4BD9C|nr:aminoglycoside adenylyltransferase domain-containing protein [Oceanobacillus timonensis]